MVCLLEWCLMMHIGNVHQHISIWRRNPSGQETMRLGHIVINSRGCASESQQRIVVATYINIWVGGPPLSLLWPLLSSYIPFAGGATLRSALGHPEGC